jgi:bifunctional DNA-binding transcriptional regulator/antitoxin component of YhaV-PrlF toxin-antitoxin module
VETLTVDQKGRVQLTKRIRRILKLKPRQSLIAKISEGSLSLSKPSSVPTENDNVLKDMKETPLRLEKAKLTKKLLDSLEEEAWSL